MKIFFGLLASISACDNLGLKNFGVFFWWWRPKQIWKG
jgi:hypothetical protein